MEANIEKAAEVMRTLGSPHRLAILCMLAERDRSVSELYRSMGVRQSLVSQHLARLREMGIVEAQREANRAFYRLTDDTVRDLVVLLSSRYPGADRDAAC